MGEGFCWWVEVFWLVGWPPDFGVVVVGFFVVVVPVLVVEVEVEVEVGVDVVPVEVEVVGGGQLSDTTTAPAGNDRLESDAPCGTCNVVSCPPSNRTVTVQS